MDTLANFGYVTGGSADYDGPVYGGYDGDGFYGGGFSDGWLVSGILIVLVILVLIVMWRMSNLRKNRLCISTDPKEYYPKDLFGLPNIPGLSYIPSVADIIPGEKMSSPDLGQRSRTDNILIQAAQGF